LEMPYRRRSTSARHREPCSLRHSDPLSCSKCWTEQSNLPLQFFHLTGRRGIAHFVMTITFLRLRIM
jgi:hypothetical protein